MSSVSTIIELIQKAITEKNFSNHINLPRQNSEIDTLVSKINTLFEILNDTLHRNNEIEIELREIKEKFKDLSDNISNYKKKEDEFKKALTVLNNSQRIAKVGNWEWDVKKGKVTWSDQIYRIFGRTPGEFEPEIEGIMKMFHPEDRVLYEKLISEALEKHQPYIFDSRIITKDGTIRFLKSTSEGIYDKNGELLYITGIVQDITEFKQAEFSLDQSERLFDNIFYQNPHPIWISDNKGTLIRANKACLIMLQITEGEVLNKYNILKDNIVIEQGYLPLVQSVYEQGKTVNFMIDYNSAQLNQLTPNRFTHILLDVTISPVRNKNGDITNAIIIHRDVTAVKKAEEELHRSKNYAEKLIESANAMIVVLDESGIIETFNRAAEEITGYRRQEVISKNWFDILVPKTKYPDMWEVYQKASQEGLPLSMESSIITKEGIERFISFRNTALYENDVFAGCLFYGIDITLRKTLEKQLLQFQKMEAIGQLAGGVAHDFNNMLSVILGYVDMIKSELSPDHPMIKNILEIEKAGIHSRDITRQLLAFSRKQIIMPKVLHINELIKNIEKTLSKLISENIDLRFIPGKDIWSVKFDPAQIDQILINLVVNACDAMPTGGILTIETANVHVDDAYCSLHMECEIGDYVLLTVSDTGIGMDKEVSSHIYEPFFTTKQLGKGTGLGLSTIYGIIKQNNCFINVYSEKGKGTIFRIYIPRIIEVKKKEESVKEMLKPAHPVAIMLVEDDSLVREMIVAILKQLGYSVVTRNTPLEAVSYFDQEDVPIDLLITDIVMPQINGKELYERIRKKKPDIKVLYMSGYTEDIIVHHGILMEGINFIQKPFSMKKFAQKIYYVLEEKEI